ncbi:hypothetical protein GGS20DRAFT_473826 [Poronia punctata]|nr:hypothetical protein GGS20DRAFT_473826 [Poronia punctata]
MHAGRALFALVALAHSGQAVFVAPDSPCATNCGNVLDSTAEDQIECSDSSYGSTAGKVFQSCVACESTSPYETTSSSNRNVSDLQAMLFNMRFATSKCLFHLEAGGPCSLDPACGHLKKALEYGNLSSTVSPYGFCSLWSDFELDKCTRCLAADKHYIRNFISILSGACYLRPEPPQTLPIEGDIFSTDLANVTDPIPTGSTHANARVGPFTYGALAGVVIGGIAVLLIFVGCGVVLNGKRRRKQYLRRREEQMKQWPSPGAGGEMFETPVSQRPLRGGGWSDSPVSAATTEGTYPYPRYFSPYATQFDSPVSAIEGPSQMTWPVEKARSIGLALSPDHDGSESKWGDRKGKDKADGGADDDGYELQEGVNSAGGHGNPTPLKYSGHAPVLNHPGYGRQGQTPSPS